MEEITITTIFKLIKAHKKQYIIAVAITFVVSAIVLFTTPNYYTSKVLLAPEVSGDKFSSSGLSGIASTMGLNLNGLAGGSGDAFFPEIYPEIVSSTTFLQQLLKIKVETKNGDFKGTLKEFLEKDKSSFSLSELFGSKEEPAIKSSAYISPKDMATIKKLNKSIGVRIDPKNEVITIDGTFEDAYVAQVVTDSLSYLLQQYIYDYRTKKSSLMLEQAKNFMNKSYREYLTLSKKSAQFTDSHHQLRLQEGKNQKTFLENEMQAKYQIYIQAIQQVTLAQAKLQAQTPVYSVIQPAIIPDRKSGPKRLTSILLIEILTTFFFTLFLLIKQKYTHQAKR